LSEPVAVVAVAGLAALAAFVGAGLAVWRSPSTLAMSLAFGLAGGVVVATVAIEMVPRAEELASPLPVVIGFPVGFAAVYLLDLFFNRWQIAGPRAEERGRVEAFHRRRRPRGDQVMVLAWGTSVEEIIEGIAIGVGVSVASEVGFIIAVAIAIDNVSEAFSIGTMIRDESKARVSDHLHLARQIMIWGSAPGVAVFFSAIAGWAALRGMSDQALAALLSIGAGSLFYLTVTDFIPEAEERQYQQSAAVAAAAGFVAIYALSTNI
jgi:ZIP family zinc transporter